MTVSKKVRGPEFGWDYWHSRAAALLKHERFVIHLPRQIFTSCSAGVTERRYNRVPPA
jgi:hypothetical protein